MPANTTPSLPRPLRSRLLVITLLLCVSTLHSTEIPRLRIASYNLENYILEKTASRAAKNPSSRSSACQIIARAQPDVVALQEVGGPSALADIQFRLGQLHLNLPYSEIVEGYDTNIQVALLSRFPITQRRSHKDKRFLVNNRRYRPTRGILDVEITLPSGYRFNALAAHLKSRLNTSSSSQQEIREQEARLLRQLVTDHLTRNPNANLVLLGDFNDTPSSLALRTLIGRGKSKLIDTRPSEQPAPTTSPHANRSIAWTHFYAREDAYTRIDYILLSPGMAREWSPSETHVVDYPDWGQASDHRPIIATFTGSDR